MTRKSDKAKFVFLMLYFLINSVTVHRGIREMNTSEQSQNILTQISRNLK